MFKFFLSSNLFRVISEIAAAGPILTELTGRWLISQGVTFFYLEKETNIFIFKIQAQKVAGISYFPIKLNVYYL